MDSRVADRKEFAIGSLTVLSEQGRLQGPGGHGRLEPRVMELLTYLARQAGEVVSRDAIIRDVWRGTQVTDAVISRSIHQIRKTFEEVGGDAALLETIPKRGYRLTIPTAPTAPIASAAGVEVAPVETPSPTRPTRHRVWAAIACGIAVVAFLVFVFARKSNVESGAQIHEPTPTRGLLILPFSHSDDTPDDIVVADGLSDELIDNFGRVENLRVIGRDSAVQIEKTARSPSEAGRALGITAVLTGTLRRTADQRVLLATKLIRTADGKLLDEEIYEASANALPALSGHVVADVAAKLSISTPETAAATRGLTANSNAYRLFLQGRTYALKNQSGAYSQAVDYFRQATTEDPSFAAAYAATAIAEMLQIDFGNRKVPDAIRAATAPAQQALRLDPQLPEAHAAIGLLALYGGSAEVAGDELRRATALRPGFSQAQVWLGRLAQRDWQMNRAVAAYERAREIEPLSPIVLLNYGIALDMTGRWSTAAEVFEKGISIEPGLSNFYWGLAHVRCNQGDLKAAEKLYSEAIERGADYSTLYGQYAILLLAQDKTSAAIPLIARAEQANSVENWLWVIALTGKSDATVSFPANTVRGALLSAVLAARANHLDEARKSLASVNFTEDRTRAFMHSEWLASAGHLPQLDVAAVYQQIGDTERAKALIDEARSFLADLKQRGLDSAGMDYGDAAAAALDGDRKRAVLMLRAALSRHWLEAPLLASDPKFVSLRGDSEFASLLPKT